MPIEIIKRILQEREEEVARREKLYHEEAEKQRRAAEEAKRKREEEEEKRRRFVTSTNTEIGQKSNLFNHLQRIDKELLDGNVNKHQFSYVAETGRCFLAWGDNFEVGKDGALGGDYNYSSIEVTIDPDNRTVTIEANNKITLKQKDWLNLRLVEEKLAEAYLDPKRHFHRIFGYSGGDSGSDMGCCCSGSN